MNYGRIQNELGAVYHGQPGQVVSKSRMDIFHESPWIFNGRYLAKTIEHPETTKDQLEGFAFHTMVLEPEKLGEQFAVMTDWPDFRTKAAQEWRKAHEEAGRSVLSMAQRDLLLTVRKEVLTDPDVQALIGGECETEVTYRRKGAVFDIQCRPDRLNLADVKLPSTGEIFKKPIVDLKLTANLEQFDKNFGPFGYHRQYVWYREVVRQIEADQAGINLAQFPDFPFHDFAFIVAEKNPPYRVALKVPDEDAIATAEREISADLVRLGECFKTGIWPKEYKPRTVERVSLPPWYHVQSNRASDAAAEVAA